MVQIVANKMEKQLANAEKMGGGRLGYFGLHAYSRSFQVGNICESILRILYSFPGFQVFSGESVNIDGR